MNTTGSNISAENIRRLTSRFRRALDDNYAGYGLIALGLSALYAVTLYDLTSTVWASDEQAHGPIVIGVAGWLLWTKRAELRVETKSAQTYWAGWLLLFFGLIAYALGRAFDVILMELGSLIPLAAAVLLLLFGGKSLKACLFPVIFLAFALPLPSALVDALTAPMKLAVSAVAEAFLFSAGYPIARTGVILQVGQYQLLVANACAGLQTLFTLEALGLLYLNLVKHASLSRNVMLAVLIVPISFVANIVRVIVLTLVTFHFGDEAGQGFMHGFAGMVLFMAGLLLIIAADSLLRFAVRANPKTPEAAA
jgi:exosortase B